ncbi:spermidine synthase [Bdellovibrio sp. HCB337]|uniref:spermidine synthase n=1 Tax=Bdellovibrio sp. HCB337 TaxID=3394358 RepID=UPI0039A598CE
MAKTFAVTLGEEIIGFCLSSALFIVGIGFGSRHSAKAKDPLSSLFHVELTLMVVGAVAPLVVTYLSFVPSLRFIQIGSINLPPVPLILIFFLGSGSLSFYLGRLTGYETPLLFRLRPDQKDARSLNHILGFSYFGALAASLFMPLFLIPRLEIYGSALLIALFSGLISLYILTSFPQRYPQGKRALVIAFGLVVGIGFLQKPLQQAALRLTYYSGFPSTVSSWYDISEYISDLRTKINVDRTLSPYQAIDIVHGSDEKPYFQLYLNRQFQFDSRFEREYHYAFLQGALKLAPFTPKRVLILGAGDGLLLRDVLATLPETTDITMVELDPIVLQFAKEDPAWVELNQNSLASSRVKLLTDDAFHFLRETNETWDAVLLDFPYPYSFEVAKLFSLEFYRLLHKRLSTQSFIVFDFPLRGSSEVIHSTLQKVPFQSIIAYEKGETFVFATDLSLDSLKFENFKSEFQQITLPPAEDGFVHSLFKPTLPRIEE